MLVERGLSCFIECPWNNLNAKFNGKKVNVDITSLKCTIEWQEYNIDYITLDNTIIYFPHNI